MLTKGLSIHNNQYELLVDKLERLLADRGISNAEYFSCRWALSCSWFS